MSLPRRDIRWLWHPLLSHDAWGDRGLHISYTLSCLALKLYPCVKLALCKARLCFPSALQNSSPSLVKGSSTFSSLNVVLVLYLLYPVYVVSLSHLVENVLEAERFSTYNLPKPTAIKVTIPPVPFKGKFSMFTIWLISSQALCHASCLTMILMVWDKCQISRLKTKSCPPVE